MNAQQQNPAPSRILYKRFPFTSWARRHPAGAAILCFAAATWQVFLGVLMCSYGYWLGLLPLAAAVVTFTASYYLVQRIPSPSPSPVQSTPSEPAVLASVR
jgi:CHASE2 domain-containing sensor protein